MQFLNKLYSKAIYSEAPELNLTAYDMGEGMLSAKIDEPIVNRLKTATGTVGSLSIIVPVQVSVDIVKTAPAFNEYAKRILSNGYIGGTLTIYDDVNTPYVIKDVSLNLSEVPSANGTNASLTYTIDGNLEVNTDALKS